MAKINSAFRQLIFDAGEVLKNKLLRTPNTVTWYRIYWRRMYRELLGQGIIEFTSTVGRDYLLKKFGNLDYANLAKRDKDLIKIVNVLCEFYDTGTLMSTKEKISLNQLMRQQVDQFVLHLEARRLKQSTIRQHEHYLSRFLVFLEEKRVMSMNEIDKIIILDYIKTLNIHKPSIAHMTLTAIRIFLKYLFEKGKSKIDASFIVPKDNYKKQAKLPSVFKIDEIQQMIGAIDRSTACGKRNYAIALLAARLGLRASDIARIQFKNLHWEQSTIIINQYKTGRELQLPILADVGEAVIEYLKYGRPASEESFVFLVAHSPFRGMTASCVTNIVNKAFVASGVNIDHRHHGPHALRHSLASLLLEQRTILPVITEVLGHENSNSTRYYLRIDLASMKQCILDVPPVPNDFYSQKGGYFYV